MANANWPPRVALITGAGSGLGRQLATLLAAQHVAIASVDIKAEGLESLGQDLRNKGEKVEWAVADVTNAKGLRGAVQALEARLGPVDLLIASAGIGVETSALYFAPQTFATVIEINLIGVANSVAAVLPGMLARGRGQLAAISSLASFHGLPFMAAYCASKSGVNSLFEAIRVELRPRGILTTIACPGWVRTPMTAQLSMPIPDMLEVDDAARQILAAIRQGKRFFAFPAGIAFQVRLLQWLPAPLSDWMVNRLMKKLAK